MSSTASRSVVSLDDIREAVKTCSSSPHVQATPTIVACNLGLSTRSESPRPTMILKLEGLQVTGSFKVRGVVQQLEKMRQRSKDGSKPKLVTLSAGNYGKSLAHVAKHEGIDLTVCMPDTAPQDREDLIKSLGASVLRCPSSELMDNVSRFIDEEQRILAHPFDDLDLIAGHGTCGLELLDQLRLLDIEPDSSDVICLCCGGGGHAAGVSAALKLSGCKARIVAVEPEGAPGQYNSRIDGKAVKKLEVNTVASGLAPPFAGEHCFQHFQRFIDDIVLVNDDDIRSAMRSLFELGVVAEPSGVAGKAGLDDLAQAPQKVVCIVSGSNTTPSDLAAHVAAAPSRSQM